jgi:molybdopterin molybdotransferase
VRARVRALGVERVGLDEALDRILGEDVIAGAPLPPFDNSAMDGFAIRAGDTVGASESEPVKLSVIGESRAGTPAPGPVGAGQAVAISTGAVLPAGADAVIPLEDVGGDDSAIEIVAETTGGKFVRRRGDDIETGAEVLPAGTVVGPAELGVLASLGIPMISCTRRPRVSLVISGDELARPGAELAPGQIHDSNAFTLGALTKLAGAELASTEHVGDDLAAIRAVLERSLEADLTVISGGVSVGRHDHVRAALADLGVEQRFWGVAIRPGRPTWFGTQSSGALVFGIPGNPVSAMVGFTLLVRPALMVMQGASPDRRRTTAVLEREYPKQPGRAHAVRCRLELRADGWHAIPTRPEQASHILTSMLGADALALIPASSGDVMAGERVEIELLS